VDDRKGVDMTERTAEQATVAQPDEDRTRWGKLRAAAYMGRLWPDGFKELDAIHARHPEWRNEW
jgi:hypothetical protein